MIKKQTENDINLVEKVDEKKNKGCLGSNLSFHPLLLKGL